jgi:hypothetical protein
MGRVFVADFERPWRMDDDDAIGPVAWQRRRLAPDFGGLLGDLHPPERAVNMAAAVHVGERFGEFLRVFPRGAHDSLGLLIRPRVAKTRLLGGDVPGLP